MTDEPFLSNLGVPVELQIRTPTAKAMPPAFNPNNPVIWAYAVDMLKPIPGQPYQEWAVCIKNYLDLCEKRQRFPFQDIHEGNNDKIVTFLKERRAAFVKFVNQTDLFEMLRFKSTHHKVTATDRGFILEVYAQMQVTDPTFFDWLTHTPLPHFNPKTNAGEWRRPLIDGLSVFVRNERVNMKERWQIGYDIACPMYPDLPNNGVPSKAEIETFVLNIFWMPILRTLRPIRAMHRLI